MIYATSDLHGNLPPIPEDATTLLLVGDICPDFRPSNQIDWVDTTGHQQAAWLDNDFRAWLDTRPDGCEVVAIWGNHDFVGEQPGLIPDLPWTLLRDEEVEVEGLRVYGTPWVPGLPYWAFYATDMALVYRAAAIPSDLHVLMTHGPPWGFGDFIPTSPKQQTKYGNYDGAHVGDRALTDAIREKSPRVVLCGHIHEARGSYLMDGKHMIMNIAAVDALYELHPDPWVSIGNHS
jgi:Icc-related predicted phosphoesterase